MIAGSAPAHSEADAHATVITIIAIQEAVKTAVAKAEKTKEEAEKTAAAKAEADATEQEAVAFATFSAVAVVTDN